MKIKLYTDRRADSDGRKPVRLSVSYLGKRCITSLGCAMNDAEFASLCNCFYGEKAKCSVKHSRHDELLRILKSISGKLEWEIEKAKRGDIPVKSIDVIGIINDCKGKKKPSNDGKIIAHQLFLQFIESEKKKKDLSSATLNQMFGIYRDIKQAFPTLTIEEASSKVWLQEYIDLFVKRGYNTNTIRGKYRYVHWFLKWAFQNDYCNDDFARFRFELKVADTRERLVVFLTMDEIMAIRDYDAEPNSVLCKDIFLFQCFTGLRYSDAIKIKNTDLHGDVLTIFTQKTGVLLHNKLNKYALEIAEKYHNKFGETLFPHVSDGTINVHIRQICRQIGINEIVTKYEYRNHQRIEITGPKWQFITTHVGRKSFVVNSLDMGLTATQVIGYTGHSSITAMQPYISISQKKKDAAMDVWNNADEYSVNKDEVAELKTQIEALKRRVEELSSAGGVVD